MPEFFEDIRKDEYYPSDLPLTAENSFFFGSVLGDFSWDWVSEFSGNNVYWGYVNLPTGIVLDFMEEQWYDGQTRDFY